MALATEYPTGARLRDMYAQFRVGTVTGHNRKGWPIVHLDGDPRGYVTHPARLITEAAYNELTAATK